MMSELSQNEVWRESQMEESVTWEGKRGTGGGPVY